MKRSKLLTSSLKHAPKEELSVNSQLLIRGGFIDRLMAGVYSFLPLGYRVLTKIEQIIREEMVRIGGQEVLLPALQPKELWDQTGRWETVDVLFKFKGSGNRDLTLGPTHEEVVTPLVAKFIPSYKNLPTSVFQIQTKFRDEARAKAGLLRGREFRMKDMYSFHTTEADLDNYYEEVKRAYDRIFARCGIGENTFLTYASGGIFSRYSHEYQTTTSNGEDIIHVCMPCRVAINQEVLDDQAGKCPVCSGTQLEKKKAIEVANIFKLMDRFSNAFGVTFLDEAGGSRNVLMGCYGMGPSRVMGAIVEVHHDAKGIIWPGEVSPYEVHLLDLFQVGNDHPLVMEIYDRLAAAKIDVLLDDRHDISAGAKFAEADLLGIPRRLLVSSRTAETSSAELKLRSSGEVTHINIQELLQDPRQALAL